MANKFITQVPLENLTSEQFLMLYSNALNNLGWQHQIVGEISIIGSTGTSISSWGEEITINIENGVATLKSSCTQLQLIDWGKNKKNINKLLENVELIKHSFTPEDLDKQLEELKKQNEAAIEDFKERFEKGELTATEKMAVSQGKNYITYGLMAINAIIFILMCISGVSIFEPLVEDLIKWGGNIKVYTTGGDWWRLFTNIFLHGGIIHLALNMYALFFIGSYLEPMLGKGRFIIVYLCAGLLASITSIWWHDNVVSVGASGAIFGLYGVFLALLTTNLIDKESRKSLLQSILIFVGYNLLYGLKGNIDNAAHIGGLVSGFIFGYILYLGIKKEENKTASTIAVVIVALGFSFLFLNSNKTDIGKYQKTLDTFSQLENKALEPFQNNVQNQNPEEFAKKLNSISLPAWKNAKVEIEKAMTFSLPENLYKQRMHLKDYINLRIKETELLIIRTTNVTEANTKELNGIESSIDMVLELIKSQSTK